MARPDQATFMAGHATAVPAYTDKSRPAAVALSHIGWRVKSLTVQPVGQHDGEPRSIGPIKSCAWSTVLPEDVVLKNAVRLLPDVLLPRTTDFQFCTALKHFIDVSLLWSRYSEWFMAYSGNQHAPPYLYCSVTEWYSIAIYTYANRDSESLKSGSICTNSSGHVLWLMTQRQEAGCKLSNSCNTSKSYFRVIGWYLGCEY